MANLQDKSVPKTDQGARKGSRLISRHGRFLLDVERCQILDRPVNSEEGRTVVDVDTLEGLLEAIPQAIGAASEVGLPGEARSIKRRVFVILAWTRSSRDHPPDRVAQEFGLERAGRELYFWDLEDQPHLWVWKPGPNVWALYHKGRRISACWSFLHAAYAARREAERLSCR